MVKKKKSLVDRLEKRFGKLAIPELGRYIIALYALGTIISLVKPDFYYDYLSLDFQAIFSGQVWRLVTFFIQPAGSTDGLNFIWAIIALTFYFWVFQNLEKTMGTFRLNLYFFSGVLLNVLSTLVFYLFCYFDYGIGFNFPTSLDYVNSSLFLAFCFFYPEVQVLFMMFLPVKVKWLGYLWGIMMGVDFVRNIVRFVEYGFSLSYLYLALSIIVSIGNFIVFYFALRRKGKAIRAHEKMGRKFTRAVNIATSGARHKCVICNRTELDDESLEFRFCSKCSGNKEYCNIHLFTHTHN